MKKFTVYLFVLLLFLCYSAKLNCMANNDFFNEAFSFDEIILILPKKVIYDIEEHRSDLIYGLKCKSVEDLTSSFTLNKNKGLDTSFRQILKVNLNTNDEGNFFSSIKYLKSLNLFEYISPNYILPLWKNGESSDMSRSSIASNSLPYERIYVPEAKEFISNLDLNNVNIGVLDYGVDQTHSDLYGKVSNLSWSYSTDVSPFIDGYTYGPHGTPIAGIIVSSNSNINKISINDSSSIVSLRHNLNIEYNVFGENGPVLRNASSVVDAINYANANNIRVINFSYGYDINDISIKTAISNYTGLFVCGAGNSGKDLDSSPTYPASYNLDNIITVGGMTNTYSLSVSSNSGYNSNYGKNSVDLFAPSAYIYTTTLNSGYDYFSGTSYAAPFVAGIASLILSIEDYCDIKSTYNMSFTGKDLKYLICNSVSYCHSLKDYCIYEGFVNALNSLQSAISYYPIIGYESYNSQYHKVIKYYGDSYEEHDWQISSLVSPFAVNPSPTILKCSKCGVTQI